MAPHGRDILWYSIFRQQRTAIATLEIGLSSHTMRNEMRFWLRCLHRPIPCSGFLLARDEKYLCLREQEGSEERSQARLLLSHISLRIAWEEALILAKHNRSRYCPRRQLSRARGVLPHSPLHVIDSAQCVPESLAVLPGWLEVAPAYLATAGWPSESGPRALLQPAVGPWPPGVAVG
jgi:hypothetical protein